MPRYSKLANFARTRGAKDKRPRKKRSDLLDREYKGARTIEMRTRSIANLGRTLNSIGNSVREARLTAKWLGVDPSRKRSDPMSIVRNARSVSDTGNSILRLGRGLFGMRSLNSMMAEFRRGKDKKKRKQRTLLGSIGRGAATGAKILAPLGVIGGTAIGLKLAKSPEVVKALEGASTRPFVAGAGIGGGLYGGVSGAALGAAGGAGAYGISRLRNKNKDTKRSPLSVLRK